MDSDTVETVKDNIKDQSGKFNSDGLINEVSGLGTKRDKSKYTNFNRSADLSDEQLSSMFADDGLTKNIVSILPEDMIRNGFIISNDEDKIIFNKLIGLNYEKGFTTALNWKRLYGGALIVIGTTGGGKLDKPLQLQNVKSVDYLKVYERTMIDITQCQFYTDPNSPNYGQVEIYKIENPLSNIQTGIDTYIKVHSSRCLEFFGETAPKKLENITADIKYWGMNVVQSIWEEIKDLTSSTRELAVLMQELVISYHKWAGLDEMVAEGNEGMLAKRLEVVNLFKSIYNAVLMDDSDSVERTVLNLSGVKEIIEIMMLMVSAVSRYPATKLFGRSPAGENATGKSDIDNYNDLVQSKQRLDLLPPLKKLVKILSVVEDKSLLSPLKKLAKKLTKKQKEETNEIEELKITFNPLIQMTEKEKAEIEKLKADKLKLKVDAMKVLIEQGVLLAEEVALILNLTQEDLEKIRELKEKGEYNG